MLKTILLTGSGGFVGRNLKEYFSGKYSLLRPRSFELDLTDKNKVAEYFELHNIDFIIHCASIGGVRDCKDPDNCLNDNLAMVQNLLDAKSPDTKMIIFGSGAAYSKNRELHKIKESQIGETIPQDFYGKSKMELAKLTLRRDDMLCLNIFACYGKFEKDSRFPTYAIKQNLNNEPIVINQNVIFDYLYVEDLCKIVEAFIREFPKNKVINVTPTESISIYDIVRIVNEISDFKSEIIFKQNGFNYEYTGDNSLLRQELSDFEFTSYKNGLSQLYEFYKKAYAVR